MATTSPLEQRLAQVRKDYKAQLTPREMEVLICMGEGMPAQQIADLLHIGVDTTKKYKTGIFDKLGVHSSLQAVAKAIRDGII